jgi:hypothetical protein
VTSRYSIVFGTFRIVRGLVARVPLLSLCTTMERESIQAHSQVWCCGSNVFSLDYVKNTIWQGQARVGESSGFPSVQSPVLLGLRAIRMNGKNQNM